MIQNKRGLSVWKLNSVRLLFNTPHDSLENKLYYGPWTTQLHFWYPSSIFAFLQLRIHSLARWKSSSDGISGLGLNFSRCSKRSTPWMNGSVDLEKLRWITAGSDEGLLWPLPHLSPFTLQPVGNKTAALRKTSSSLKINSSTRHVLLPLSLYWLL